MSIELPKDAKGREIPIDTEVLYDKEGERREVDWYTFYPDKDRWDVVLADSCAHFSPHNLSLTPPDSFEKLLEDLGWVLQQGGRSGHPACVYLAARGLCRGHMDKDVQCKLSDADCCVIWMVSNIRGRIKRLCEGDGE